MTRFLVGLSALLGALLVAPRPCRAEGRAPAATFALVVGSNQSVDANLAPLRYADDDAARYQDLFRLLGARTYLLTRFDDNTRRLHPQSVAEAMEPRRATMEQAVGQLVADVKQAADRGVETEVYFVYAGHGNVDDKGAGYVTLEDQRLTGGDLAAIFARVPATRIHVIVDACASYYLAYGRGPGGERRPIGSLGLGTALANDARIGLLLSTSSARESHEWDEFQAGVFSHEVRSALYGAADADHDGFVSYREVSAFIARANASVPNDRYRPDVHARAPKGDGTLLDLRRARGRRLEIDGKHAGHYYLEDVRGVRLADLHNAPGQAVSLVRPPPNGRTYLRRVDDDREFVVEGAGQLRSGEDVIALADLLPDDPRTAARGAAQDAFATLFAFPFDEAAVAGYVEEPIPCEPCEPERPKPGPARWNRTPYVIGAFALGAAGLGAGLGFTVSASNIYHGTDSWVSGQETADRNHEIKLHDTLAVVGYGVGAAAVVTGFVLLLWPDRGARTNVGVAAVPGGATLGYGGAF